MLHVHIPLSVMAAILLGWVALYVVYRVAWRRDFGLPVRRRLLCRGLEVDDGRIAFVPLWWSDLQVQRALDAYWKRTLRQSFDRSPVGYGRSW